MIGKTLAHYKVIEKIGQGGMGEVYRAEDTNLSRDVAIKVLPEQFTKDPQRLAPGLNGKPSFLPSSITPTSQLSMALKRQMVFASSAWNWSQAKTWLSVLPKPQ